MRIQDLYVRLNRIIDILIVPVAIVIFGYFATAWFSAARLEHLGVKIDDVGMTERWVVPGLFVFPLITLWLSSIAGIPAIRYRIWRAKKKGDESEAASYRKELRYWLSVNTIAAVVLWFGAKGL